MATKSGISFSANEPTRRSTGGMKRSARMTGFNRIGEVGIPTELRRQKSLGEITVHGRLLPPPSRPSQPLRRTLSTLTIIPATPSVAPPVHSRRNTVSDFDFDTPKKRQPAIAPTPHRSEDINTENDDPKKQYGPVGLGRRTRTKSGDEYTSLQDMLESSGFTDTRIITPRISNLHSSKNAIPSTYTTPSRKPRSHSTVYPPSSHNIRHSADAGIEANGDEIKVLRGSASMGLLRGVMSIWSVPPPMPEIKRTRVGREVEVSSSESGSIKTLMMDVRQRERAMSWIENVAKSSAVVPVSATSVSATTYTLPTQSPPTATPPLSPSTSAVHTSPTRSRPRSSTTPQPPVTPYRKYSPTRATTEITPRNVSQSPARPRSSTSPHIDSAHASLVGNQTDLIDSNGGYQSFSLGFTSLSPSSSGGRIEYDDLDDDVPAQSKAESLEGNGNWRSLLSFSKSLSNLRSTAMSFSSSGQSIKAKRYRSATPPPPVPPLPSAAVISTFPPIAFTPPPAPKPIPHFDSRPPTTTRAANVNTALRGPRLLRKAVSSVALKPILTTSGTGRDIPFPR